MNQSELLSRNIAKSLACRTNIGCSDKKASDTYIAQAYYIIEDKKHNSSHCPGLIIDTTGTVTLNRKHSGKIYILSGSLFEGIYIQNFITEDLTSNNAGFYIYLKNNSANDTNILMNGSPLSVTSRQTVLYSPVDQNTSLCILYWSGTDLILY